MKPNCTVPHQYGVVWCDAVWLPLVCVRHMCSLLEIHLHTTEAIKIAKAIHTEHALNNVHFDRLTTIGSHCTVHKHVCCVCFRSPALCTLPCQGDAVQCGFICATLYSWLYVRCTPAAECAQIYTMWYGITYRDNNFHRTTHKYAQKHDLNFVSLSEENLFVRAFSLDKVLLSMHARLAKYSIQNCTLAKWISSKHWRTPTQCCAVLLDSVQCSLVRFVSVRHTAASMDPAFCDQILHQTQFGQPSASIAFEKNLQAMTKEWSWLLLSYVSAWELY